jgi:hypothetical protein
MQNPSQTHFVEAKRVLIYLKGTVESGIHYMKSSSIKLNDFSDSGWVGRDDEMRSTQRSNQ